MYTPLVTLVKEISQRPSISSFQISLRN